MLAKLQLIPLGYYGISGLVNFLTAFIMSLLVFFSNPESKPNKIFAAFSFSVAYWSILYFVWINTKDKYLAEFYLRSCMIGVLFMPSLFIHFVASFLGYKLDRRFIAGNYILSTLLMLTVYTPLYAKDIGRHLVFPYWLHTGPVFHVAIIHFGGVVLYSFYLMWKTIKKEGGDFRNQVLYIFIGTAIGYISGVTNFFCWYRINIPPFLNIFVSVYVVMVAVAVLKYRLLDINVAIVRFLIFASVYSIVLVLPFWLGYSILGKGVWWQILLFGMTLASAGPFTYSYLRRRAENKIREEERRYQETLDNLSESLIEIRDIDKLSPTVSSTVGEAIKVKFVIIYLKEEEYNSFQLKSCYPKEAKSQFPELISLDDTLITILNQQRKPLLSREIGHHDKIKLDSGVVIPLFGKSGFLGFIVLGAKQNKQMYTNDDLRVLKSLSLRAASTIENCIFWKEIEDRHRNKRLQEMDSFAYSFAHEIHNPLTYVRNLARVLKERFAKYITELQDRKEFEEMCDVIFEGADRVMTIVEAIRKFGAKTTGEFETLKLQEVIDGFFTLFGPELKTNFVGYTKDMPPEPIYVKGAAADLQQVLMIFGRNSIYAMKNCQEKKLSLKVTKLNHSTVRVAVSDNGEGIKKENMDLVFRALFTTKASSEGTGMGLSNAKNFISRHNGRIWAESEGEGKGATLVFELPIVQETKSDDSQKKGKTDWAF